MESLRFLHWENSYLDQKLELRSIIVLTAQKGRLLGNLRDIHREMLLVKDMELWEFLMMAADMEKFLEILRVKILERHLVQKPELR